MMHQPVDENTIIEYAIDGWWTYHPIRLKAASELTYDDIVEKAYAHYTEDIVDVFDEPYDDSDDRRDAILDRDPGDETYGITRKGDQ